MTRVKLLIGEQIKSLRKERRWTQDDIATRLLVTKQAVSGWERNKIAPNYLQLVPLADMFDVTTDYILGRKVVTDSELAAEQHQPSSEYDLEEILKNKSAQIGEYKLSQKDIVFVLNMLQAFKHYTRQK